jgi:uncharacterized protein YecE (DUF72 family)
LPTVKATAAQLFCAVFQEVSMKRASIHIGTSGWQYKHWKGTFYPAELKQAEWFGYYLQHFDTVEINNSFYRLPSADTFAGWRKKVPATFLYAVKASRFITHMKKLKVDAAAIQQFFDHADQLKSRQGPILFQLPPGWKVNTERLADFLAALPKKHHFAFEFRNPTWYTEEVYALLRKYKCAFCIYELAGHMSPMPITAKFTYIRLHGPGDKYQGNYSNAALQKWAEQCRAWQEKGISVFVYFDNDQAGYAAFNAQQLLMLVGK